MKINLTMRSILKYSICSIFLLNFIHCTNGDDLFSFLSSLDKLPIGEDAADEDMAGFMFTPPNREVNVTEGMQVDYSVQLLSKPTGDVTLNVNPATGFSSSVVSLIFTPSNWNATQTVTITAEDNRVIGDYTAQVNHSVNSADSKYSFIAPGQVTVNVTDDDGGTGNIVISTNMLAFDDIDGATGGTYTLSLSHDPALGKTVQVDLSLSSGNSTLSVSPMVVNFGGAAGRGPKIITVTRASGASGMIMADIFVAISHTIATGVSYDPNITTFANSGNTVNVTINSTIPMVDSDHDGLIEINNAVMLNNIRYDLAGASYKTSMTQIVGDSSGCPPVVNGSGGCHGYELTANIDLLNLLDKNGNRIIEKMMVGVDKNADGDTDDTGEKLMVIDIGTGKDKSWAPISAFTGTFEGNNHTIANLWVNISSSGSHVYAGLFGVTGETSVEIRNVGIISGSIYTFLEGSPGVVPESYSGGLVGSGGSSGTVIITNSYFSGGGVSSSSSSSSSASAAAESYSGGLMGSGGSSGTVIITNSYFSGSGGVSSSAASAVASSESYSGGLVGLVDAGSIVSITNSYFGGGGGVSSSSVASDSSSSYSGGLVGLMNTGSITNGYFSGEGVSSSAASDYSSSSSYSGGLLSSGGSSGTVIITNSHFSGGGVSSSSAAAAASESYSGGLLSSGGSSGTVIITNSYFSGGEVSSSSSSSAAVASSESYSGGLVGYASTLMITNSYFSGVGEVSSSSSAATNSFSGGLVGLMNIGSITNSYFSGAGGVSSSSSSSIATAAAASESYSGGLVGYASTLMITNSYFSGVGGVSSSFSSSVQSVSSSGGLVGYAYFTLTIMNSYFRGAGGVSSSSSASAATAAAFSESFSGGLVGLADTSSIVNITNSYFSGVGGVSSSSSSSVQSSDSSSSGGLAGLVDIVNIKNSYFSGVGGVSSSSSSSSSSGGLVGDGFTVRITNGYWDKSVAQSVDGGTTNQSPKRAQGNSSTNPSGAIDLTLTELQAISMSTISAPSPSGLPHSATDNTKAWDLGTNMQLPAVKGCINAACTSYGALLAGQRP